MARIIVESGPSKGKILHLPADGAIDAGRESGRFLHLADAKVSRQHFTITAGSKGHTIEDRTSANGTFVNGKRVEVTALRTGDLIRAGDTFISFSAESADPLVGQTIAGYLLQERIGRGGMGTVYRALQTSLERVVAFKLLSPGLTEDREFVVRFLAEARTAAKLDHTNVVKIYDVGEERGLFFLSMEFMPGGSMQDAIDREGAMPMERALPMVIDAAKALVWAGEHSIVHRDIKPDNLLLAQGGNVKVADFGLAADQNKSKTLYAGGKVLGTPGYMAPEQALGQPIDHRADIYALGSTLYTTLSGTLPYTGDNPVEVLVRKVKEPPRPLTEVAPRVPAAVVAVVERMMAMKPEDRFATAKEAHAALCGALDAVKSGRGAASSLAEALVGTLKRLRGK